MHMEGEKVFVTVGTTSFDELVTSATDKAFLKLLVHRGYRNLTLQIGRGSYEPLTPPEVAGIRLEYYHFKPSLHEDMQSASLVVSHGGAGSITEALALKKPLIVVVNEDLMDNHQTELARKIAAEGYCLYTTHRKLYSTMENFQAVSLKTHEPGNPELFGQFIDKVVGFQEKEE